MSDQADTILFMFPVSESMLALPVSLIIAHTSSAASVHYWLRNYEIFSPYSAVTVAFTTSLLDLHAFLGCHRCIHYCAVITIYFAQLFFNRISLSCTSFSCQGYVLFGCQSIVHYLAVILTCIRRPSLLCTLLVR